MNFLKIETPHDTDQELDAQFQHFGHSEPKLTPFSSCSNFLPRRTPQIMQTYHKYHHLELSQEINLSCFSCTAECLSSSLFLYQGLTHSVLVLCIPKLSTHRRLLCIYFLKNNFILQFRVNLNTEILEATSIDNIWKMNKRQSDKNSNTVKIGIGEI